MCGKERAGVSISKWEELCIVDFGLSKVGRVFCVFELEEWEESLGLSNKERRECDGMNYL